MVLSRLGADPRVFAALGVAGSAALLLGALAFQYIGELAPCPMCIWQRWPHGIAILLGLGAIAVGAGRIRTPLLLAAAATELIGAGIGVYHAGVERGFWEGPTTCTSAGWDDLTTDQLMAQILSAPLVRCDEIAWEMLGLSMAGWNAVISVGLAGCFAAALIVHQKLAA